MKLLITLILASTIVTNHAPVMVLSSPTASVSEWHPDYEVIVDGAPEGEFSWEGDDTEISNQFEEDLQTFDDLDTETFGHRFKHMINTFLNAFKQIVTSMRNFCNTLEKGHQALRKFSEDFSDVTNTYSIAHVKIQPIFATIRWFTGDLVFYELYLVMMLAIVFVWLRVALVVIELVKALVAILQKLAPALVLSNFGPLSWIGQLFFKV